MKLITPTAHRRDGVAVVVMLALISILVIYVAANLRSISDLDRELKLTERHQLQRLNSLSATNAATLMIGTNAPARSL
jgi:hypothetical protein